MAIFKKKSNIICEPFARLENEVDEIIPGKPPLFARWGILLLLLMFLVLLLISWLIKYQEIVIVPAKLTPINAPKSVNTNIDGKLVKLFAKEGQLVKKNQVLGYIESTATYENVLLLSVAVDSIQSILLGNTPELIKNYIQGITMQLGELQTPYQTFSQAYLTFSNYLANGFYYRKKRMFLTDINNLKRIYDNLLEQKSLKKQELLLLSENIDTDQQLLNNNVIYNFEYSTEKINTINNKINILQIDNDIINNQLQQDEKQKEIEELNNTIAQHKSIFQEALEILRNKIEEWKKKHLLIAPVDGRISFAKFIQENQQLQSNQTICFVISENSYYFAELAIPKSNFVKIAVGQKVLLKFSSYPFQEYGSLKGRIEFISHITSDSIFYAKVQLVNGIDPSFSDNIRCQKSLNGQAEIIIHNIRLLDKFYNSFKFFK